MPFSSFSWSLAEMPSETESVCLIDLLSVLFQGHFLLIFLSVLSCFFVCLIIFFIVVVAENWTFESNSVVILEINFSTLPGFAGFCYCFCF